MHTYSCIIITMIKNSHIAYGCISLQSCSNMLVINIGIPQVGDTQAEICSTHYASDTRARNLSNILRKSTCPIPCASFLCKKFAH